METYLVKSQPREGQVPAAVLTLCRKDGMC